ncbi:MAG: serine--tRNA ligase [Patescibacteria group bacterium]
MLDIKYIRENSEKVKKAARDKGIDLDVEELLQVDKRRREMQQELDEVKRERKQLAQSSGGKAPSQEQIQKGKELKEKITELEEKHRQTEEKYLDLMARVPMVPSEDTPIGEDDAENVEIYREGEPTEFDFTPKDHIQLGKELDLFDLERGVKTAGYRGYYLKNEGAMLQMALMMYSLTKLIEKGFTPIIPPTLVKNFALFGSGFFAGRQYDPETDEIYKIANDEILPDGSVKKEDKFLVGTAEPSLLAYYAGETLEEKDLPIKFCGFSPCYRSEIGSYGKDTKGLYRIHEFMKVEQVAICRADEEEAGKLHQEMTEISKELHRELKLPFRQLQICTGDMGKPKYKMYDLEAWMPSRENYGETGSASNCKDWQSRRLNIKYKDGQGDNKFTYMLNNTALASPRILIPILENNQQKDGSVLIPEVLQKFMPGEQKIISNKKGGEL